jgi:hypothetical protein
VSSSIGQFILATQSNKLLVILQPFISFHNHRDIIVFRSHHAIGDGLSLVQMMNWIFDIENKDFHSQDNTIGSDLESGLMSSPKAPTIALLEEGGGERIFTALSSCSQIL